MTAGRALGSAAFGAFVGLWLGRALFKWILDVPADWARAGMAAFALIGAVLVVAGAAEEARNGR